MHLIDDHGEPLDAEYDVEPDGEQLSIILESMSGRADGRPSRNTQYRPALELLLARLKDLDAVLEAAVVDSRVTQRLRLDENARALTSAPIRLADVTDLLEFRRDLTNRQTTIAQAPDARRPGNSTKRIRLRVSVPGYQAVDADRLSADLATGLAAHPDPAAQDARAEARLLEALGVTSELVHAEKVHVTSTTYERTAATVVVRRAEAVLVARYRDSLPDVATHRLRSAVGHTDLYLNENREIIEAKRGSDHRYVREALGQLLDYAVNVTEPVRCLTALFPAAPSEPDIALLHTYGVDCLYWDGDSRFARRAAPAERREAMQSLWATVLDR
jgi:hypothetical protein